MRSSVASKYDVMNDVMSFGIHRIWKNKLLDWMNLLKLPGEANFMALDKLIVQDFTYPQSKNAKALIELVKFKKF